MSSGRTLLLILVLAIAAFSVGSSAAAPQGIVELRQEAQTQPQSETVNGVLALRGIIPSARVVFLGFHTTATDGGQGFFRGVTAGKPGTFVDNNGTVIVPKGGDGSAAWLRIYSGGVDIRWFGAKADGISDDTNAVEGAIAASRSGDVEFYGSARVTSTINLNDFGGAIIFHGKSKILAGRDNLVIFQSTTNAWGARIVGAIVDCNGFVNVTAFDLSRFQAYGAVIERPSILNCTNGIILRNLNWGARIDSPYIQGTQNPIVLMDGNSAVQINHPRIDTFGGIGIDIQKGKEYPNVGVQILNGYIQNGDIGIQDAAYNTQVIGTYFERCSVADVLLAAGSSYFSGISTSHTSVGAVAYKGRHADSARIIHPFMSSGARRIGLFDFDNSNSNCIAEYARSSDAKNQPVGLTAGIMVRAN